ncbi:MAG: sulfotransferase [Sphingomicrobium sp.]
MDQIRAALGVGDVAEAEFLLRAQLLAMPSDIGAIARLAELAGVQGKTVEAIALLRTALAIEPAAHELRLRLAQLHRAQGHVPEAMTHIELLPQPVRCTFEVMAEEAGLLGQLGRREEEIALYEELLRQEPRRIRSWISLANALNYCGRPVEAIGALRRAIKIRPSSGEPWWSLANLKSFRFDNHDIAAMQRALRRSGARENSLQLHFALGSAFEARGNYARSFDHYAAGNLLRAQGLQAHQIRVTGFVDEAIPVLSEALFKRLRGAGCPTSQPIFIVGLQRSGSTLLEQILSSHSQIEGASELVAMQQVWAGVERQAVANGLTPFGQLAAFQPSAVRALGEEYLERTKPFRPLNRPFFVDKLPANWLNIGLIRLALPNAKIIDARRNPMACGFSNFKQLYGTGVTYAYSLQSIGWFYRDYLRLMRHIDQLQPGAVHRVIHDRLVENPEREVRRMLNYILVPFDRACLKFHENPRFVPTPSAEQVRRPINRDGRDAWQPYKTWLGPLKEALGPALSEWAEGAFPTGF